MEKARGGRTVRRTVGRTAGTSRNTCPTFSTNPNHVVEKAIPLKIHTLSSVQISFNAA
jgi:hypothetical protein